MINETYINYSILYHIATQILQTNIMLTPLMTHIFTNILNKNEEHIIFWNSLNYKHSIKESELITNFITHYFPLIYKYTMLDKPNDMSVGYWVDPNETQKAYQLR